MSATIVDAIMSLCPGAVWELLGDDYSGLNWLDTTQAKPTESALTAQIAILAAIAATPTVLSQDLMAQFTAADATAIQSAVASNSAFWLLWSAMQAQKDPMAVTNARFMAGWAALVQVLGQPRMTAIATALGVTIA